MCSYHDESEMMYVGLNRSFSFTSPLLPSRGTLTVLSWNGSRSARSMIALPRKSGLPPKSQSYTSRTNSAAVREGIDDIEFLIERRIECLLDRFALENAFVVEYETHNTGRYIQIDLRQGDSFASTRSTLSSPMLLIDSDGSSSI